MYLNDRKSLFFTLVVFLAEDNVRIQLFVNGGKELKFRYFLVVLEHEASGGEPVAADYLIRLGFELPDEGVFVPQLQVMAAELFIVRVVEIETGYVFDQSLFVIVVSRIGIREAVVALPLWLREVSTIEVGVVHDG